MILAEKYVSWIINMCDKLFYSLGNKLSYLFNRKITMTDILNLSV